MSNESIYMLNVLWFKKDGGEEKYREYMAAVEPILGDMAVELAEGYTPEQALIGDWNPDLFFVVKYPDQASFESLIDNSEYRKIMHLREEALEDSLLIRCSKKWFEE